MAQYPKPIGAENLVTASTSVYNYAAFFNNPAGFGNLKTKSLHAYYVNNYGIAGLSTTGINLNLPTKKINISVGAQNFGDDLYNETLIGLALSKLKNKVSFGLKASIYQISIKNYASKASPYLELGMIVQSIPKLNIGLHVLNINSAKLLDTNPMPFIARIGASYYPTKQLIFSSDIETNLSSFNNLKISLDYQFYPKYHFRTGINPFLKNTIFGIGISKYKFIFDYTTISNQNLGLSHSLSLGYIIK